MPGPKRTRRERTEEWASIKQWTLWPEQELYEQIRPLVLFHQTAGERAKEIDVPQRTLSRKADAFEKYGMASLFSSGEQGGARETQHSLPPEMRQLIVDLHAEHPGMSWREIAEICYIRYGRKPSHHSVQRVIAEGPAPSLTARRYQPWEMISDPAERRLAVIRLHAEGWSITSIAKSLQTSRPTIYATLKRWAQEGIGGLEDKSRARKGPRKATLSVRNEVRKLQENPLLGEYRVHTALLRMGINVSPATCGRIMAVNRKLYGLQKPPRSARPKREMPFKASRRHDYWSIDVRYIEHHQLPNVKGPVYVISVLENFSRMLLASSIRHSPKEVLRGVLARTLPESLLAQIFFTSQVTCHLDRSGYLRFRRWRFYAEAGLAKKPVIVHLSTNVLRVEYENTDLALYTVIWHEDYKHITEVA